MSTYTIDEAVEKRFNNLKCRPREYVVRILLEDIERIWRRCRDLQDRIEALESNSHQIKESELQDWEKGFAGVMERARKMSEDPEIQEALTQYDATNPWGEEYVAGLNKIIAKFEAKESPICPGQTDILAMINNPDNQIRSEKQRLAAVKRFEAQMDKDLIEPDYDALVRGMEIEKPIDLPWSIGTFLQLFPNGRAVTEDFDIETAQAMAKLWFDTEYKLIKSIWECPTWNRPFTKADYERLKNV